MSLLFCSLSNLFKVAIFIRPLEEGIYTFLLQLSLDIIGTRISMLLIIMHTQ
jgi:hypothetical protein